MNATASTRKKGQMSVAEFLTHQIEVSGKKQKDIAEELDYEKPNIITMFKQGRTPLPMNKIAPMARALGVDTIHLFRIVMKEYHPHSWEAIEGLIGKYAASKNEMEILDIIRETAQGYDVRPSTDEERLELMALVEKWRNRQEQLGVTALRKDIEKKK